MDAVAVRYAESLFDLAKEMNQVEAYSKDIDLIRTVFESDPMSKLEFGSCCI